MVKKEQVSYPPTASIRRPTELLFWSVSTAIVMVIAWIALLLSYLTYFVAGFASLSSILQLLLSMIAGMVAGAVVGVSQWLVLRREVRWANRWIWATVAGWGLAAIAWWSEYKLLGGSHFQVSEQYLGVATVLAGAITGTAIGLGQWIIMRRFVMISILWVLGSMISWLAGAIVSATVITSADFGYLTYLIAMLAPSLFVGLGTGLIWRKFIR